MRILKLDYSGQTSETAGGGKRIGESRLNAGSFEVGIFRGSQRRSCSSGSGPLYGGHRPLNREALNANFATSVDREQCRDRLRIKPLSGKVLNDLQSFFRSVRMLVRAVGG